VQLPEQALGLPCGPSLIQGMVALLPSLHCWDSMGVSKGVSCTWHLVHSVHSKQVSGLSPTCAWSEVS
jgi:hypothetical protein